jgi:hypothetical protein
MKYFQSFPESFTSFPRPVLRSFSDEEKRESMPFLSWHQQNHKTLDSRFHGNDKPEVVYNAR